MDISTKDNQFPFPEYEENTYFTKFRDQLLLIIFLGIGLAGTLYNLYSMTYTNDKSELNPIYQETSITNRLLNNANKISASNNDLRVEKPILKNQLSIGENQEATIPVQFRVNNFNRDASYHLTFGDGVIQELVQSTTAHVYKKPGQYQVKLEVTYRGERRVLDIDQVNIMQPFTVAANAIKYDF